MNKKTKIISVHSGKGGVGKTTIVANLGARLAATGARTLLVDADFFTRGMTFLLAQHQISAEMGYLEVLQQQSSSDEPEEFTEQRKPKNVAKTSYLVKENLYLLPPTRERGTSIERRDADSEYISRILMESIESESTFQSSFRNYVGEFDFVLFDCRSGTDKASIAPAFLADEYWIVTEEDNTSIRATNFLLDSIDFYASNLKNGDKKPFFGGFIVNMIVSSRPDFIALSLQRILSGPCLAVAPLSRRAREAFIEDKLVVDTRPHDSVSREIVALADQLLGGSKASAVDRLKKHSREGIVRRASVIAVLAIAPLWATGLLMVTGRSDLFELDLVAPLLWIFGLAAGVVAANYFSRRL